MILHFFTIRFILFFRTFPKIVSCHSNLMICFYVYFHWFFSSFVNLLIFTLLSLERLMSWQQMINNCSYHSINIYLSISPSLSRSLSISIDLSISLSSYSLFYNLYIAYHHFLSFFSYSSLRSECRMDARKLANFGRVPWGKYVFIEYQIY